MFDRLINLPDKNRINDVSVVEISDVARMLFDDPRHGKAITTYLSPWSEAFYEYALPRGHGSRNIFRAGIFMFYMKPLEQAKRALIRKTLEDDPEVPPGFYHDHGEDSTTHFGALFIDETSGIGPIDYTEPHISFGYVTDKNGEMIRGSLFTKTIKSYENKTDEQVVNALMPMFLAINLLHCKNVTTENHVTPQKVQAKRIRSGKPPGVTFKTLVIKPPKGRALRLYTPGNAHNARHIVRGHFKTFTAAKPLLGKHTGRYFFVQHTRGRDHTREVKKDYKVQGDS